MNIKPNKQALEMLESPWLNRQVENHLLFGPLSRGGSISWIFFIAIALLTILLIEGFPNFSTANFDLYFNILYASIIIFIFYKFPSYHRAAVLWCVVKFTIITVAFLMLVAGGVVGFFKGSPDAIHITLLAFIWFPSLEFFPKFVEKQKIITLSKVVISIPITILWQQTGTWH